MQGFNGTLIDTDVLVIGAGAGGLFAALSAKRNGPPSGPTGGGQAPLAEPLARVLNVRAASADAATLTEAGDETKVGYAVESTLAGKLGSIGQPVLRSKAKDMEKIFASRLQAHFAPA